MERIRPGPQLFALLQTTPCYPRPVSIREHHFPFTLSRNFAAVKRRARKENVSKTSGSNQHLSIRKGKARTQKKNSAYLAPTHLPTLSSSLRPTDSLRFRPIAFSTRQYSSRCQYTLHSNSFRQRRIPLIRSVASRTRNLATSTYPFE